MFETVLENTFESIQIELDKDVVRGLCRLRAVGFPISIMISESLRPFINSFLPLADLYEQGKLTVDNLSELRQGLEYLVIKTEVAKVRLDRELKISEKQKKKLNCG